jgi:hypothetical protein
LQKPKLLIVTGPQGSGNHLFSKILSKHPLVQGWRMQSYWEGHHTEPFNDYWQNPNNLANFDWTHQYYFTSISCPYVRDKKLQTPKYQEFIECASKYADIKVAIIGRDKTILNVQQTRVRKQPTTSIALDAFEYLFRLDHVFISQELYQLYGNAYLQSVSKQLDFPIAYQAIKEDANSKYINTIDEQPLDLEVFKACKES